MSPASAEDHELSLADAIKTAISHDAQLYIAREDTRIADDGVDLARSAFRPRLFGQIYGLRDERPPTARSFALRDDILAGDVGLSGLLPMGTSYTLSAGLVRERVASTFVSVYDPARTVTGSVELVQPLLRGAFSAARRPIVVASLRKRQSKQELRAQLETTVGNVEIAYWNLVRARAERDARTAALSIATEQVEESKRLRRVGTGSDLDIVEAETGVSRRQQELLVTEQDVVDAEGQLMTRLGVRAGEDGWIGANAIIPTDKPQLDARDLDLDAQLQLARTRRAEVLAARDRTAAEKAELAVRDDQRSMALDVVMQASTAGFAGRLAESNLTAGVNGGGLSPPYFTDPDYDGTTGRALANTLGKDLRFYLGLRFEILLGNSEADARHAIQRRTVSRARLAERQTLAQVETEVRTTIAQAVLGARKVTASENTVKLAEKFLEGVRKRVRAGAATTFDVLRVSEELTRARVELARVRADYRITLTRLGVVTGTLLDTHRISTKSLAATPRI